MIGVDIALCLVELRTKLGMSRTSFAKSVGSSHTSTSNIKLLIV